jgi:hypothetical protein
MTLKYSFFLSLSSSFSIPPLLKRWFQSPQHRQKAYKIHVKEYSKKKKIEKKKGEQRQRMKMEMRRRLWVN